MLKKPQIAQGLLVLSLVLLMLLPAPPAFAQVKVVVKGVSRAVEENVLAHLGEFSKSDLEDAEQLKRRVAPAARKATRALGYYQSKVSYEVSGEKLTINIVLSEPVRVVAVSVDIEGEGADFPALQEQLDSLPFARGDILEHYKYDDFKKRLLKISLQRGFLDARYTQRKLKVNVREKTAVVELVLNTGKRYRVGAISFNGSRLTEDILHRLSPFKAGDFYDAERLIQFRRNLMDTRYFQSATVNSRVVDEQVNLIADLQDARQHQYDVGIGFSTDTGPRTRFGWSQPQLNEKGHSSHVEAKWSKPEQEVTGRYVIPLLDPLKNFLQFDTGWQKKEVEDTRSQITNIGALLSDIDDDLWRTDYTLNLEYERYQQGSQETTEVLYLIPGVAWSQTMLPAGIDPMSGSRYWIRLEGSTEELGSDTDFFKAHGLIKWLIDLGNDNSLMTLRAEGGAIVTDNIRNIPASHRFFTGGDQSVRGYSFESLAPEDDAGELIGGQFLNVASIELSHRVKPTWRAALFADTGRAYNEPQENFSTGVGIGVRWLSPIGQVRLDLAFPLDEDDTDFRIHLSMGPPL